jgi:tRNA threonylcarbamoyladenosine biosynthesis protein TsaB
MTCLLALETATEACSVALAVDGRVLARHEIAPRRHAELVLPMCRDLIAEAGIARSNIDAVAVGRGPGAFTGVRLAIAIAQGLALAWDRPVVPVSTLAALAHGAAPGADAICAAIDARMGEVYLGLYRRSGGELVAVADEQLVAPAAAQLPDGAECWCGIGTGFAAQDALLARRLESRLVGLDASALPTAAAVAALALAAHARGEGIDAAAVRPVYLRDKVADTMAERAARAV